MKTFLVAPFRFCAARATVRRSQLRRWLSSGRLSGVLLLTVAGMWSAFGQGAQPAVTNAILAAADRPSPRLSPDYTGIVLPPNIAPLNFRIEEPGSRYRVTLRSTQGEVLRVESRKPTIRFPLKPWQRLVRANAGEPLICEISVLESSGQWRSFPSVTNLIAREPIDRTLTYRLLKPLYSVYENVGIYQRDLESFEQRPVLENRHFNRGCLNCHISLERRPDTFAFHIRTATNVHPMILVRSNVPCRVDKTMGYLAWHPSGQLIAYSGNKLSLFYHTRGETRDVFDARSDLGIYRLDSNTFSNPAPIAQTNRNETWPAWSPDGRYLYFSSATPLSVEEFRQVRYDLMRVSYDLATDRWGQPELLLAASASGGSATQPKVSPDGRYLLFCISRYGNFPVYQASSDLYVMDLATLQLIRPNINSERTESWHCWSGNSRWVVFSSKRLDGLFSRPFFSYVDAQGNFHKPFLLPQADPEFYESFLKNFNVPELLSGSVSVSERTLAETINCPSRRVVPSQVASEARQSSTAPESTDPARYPQ